MRVTTDKAFLTNLLKLIEKKGITPLSCELGAEVGKNYISRLKTGKLKYIRLCDAYKIADYLGSSIDGLCDYKAATRTLLSPRENMQKRDSKIILRAFLQLDPDGRAAVVETMNAQFARMKNQKKFVHYSVEEINIVNTDGSEE